MACLGRGGILKDHRPLCLQSFIFNECPVPVWDARTLGNWWGCQSKKLMRGLGDDGPGQFVFRHDNMGRESEERDNKLTPTVQ